MTTPPIELQTDPYALQSTHIERLLEHRLLGELLAEAWRHGRQPIEVLRPEVDASGYDIVLGHGGYLRPMQLKTRRRGGTPISWSVQRNLERYPGACVVVIHYEKDSFDISTVGYFGSREPTGRISLASYPDAVNATTKKRRHGSCELPPRVFDRLAVPELLVALFPAFAKSVHESTSEGARVKAAIDAALASGQFEVSCGDSHSLWRKHQLQALHRKMFEALVATAKTSTSGVTVSISAGGKVVASNVTLRRVTDDQLTWRGASVGGNSASPVEVTIQLAR